MAKQKSVIKLKGTLGDITFVKTEDGYLAREKTSVNAERIANDPAFARTRENNKEFGRAGKAVKLVRSAFRMESQSAKDSKLTSRMLKVMMKVVKADPISERGLRNVTDGVPAFLEGFEFNRHAEMSSTVYAQYTAAIDRVTGALSVTIPSFLPKLRIIVPDGATHFKIISAGSEIDFENEKHNTVSSDSGLLPWDNTATAPITLSNAVSANSTLDLFLVLGIQFFQMVNGTAYPLQNGAFNALSLIKVDGA